jgi:hypothetical protein
VEPNKKAPAVMAGAFCFKSELAIERAVQLPTPNHCIFRQPTIDISVNTKRPFQEAERNHCAVG